MVNAYIVKEIRPDVVKIYGSPPKIVFWRDWHSETELVKPIPLIQTWKIYMDEKWLLGKWHITKNPPLLQINN